MNQIIIWYFVDNQSFESLFCSCAQVITPPPYPRDCRMALASLSRISQLVRPRRETAVANRHFLLTAMISSLRLFQYIVKQTVDENGQIYQLGGVVLTWHRIIPSNFQANAWQLEGRIADEVLAVEGLLINIHEGYLGSCNAWSLSSSSDGSSWPLLEKREVRSERQMNCVTNSNLLE